jgi:hypothetical protein
MANESSLSECDRAQLQNAQGRVPLSEVAANVLHDGRLLSQSRNTSSNRDSCAQFRDGSHPGGLPLRGSEAIHDGCSIERLRAGLRRFSRRGMPQLLVESNAEGWLNRVALLCFISKLRFPSSSFRLNLKGVRHVLLRAGTAVPLTAFVTGTRIARFLPVHNSWANAIPAT